MLDWIAYAYGVRSRTKWILGFRGVVNTSSLRKLFFESLSVVFMASVPCLPVVASLDSSYSFIRGTAFLRGVAMGFLCLRVVGSSFRRLRYILRQVLDVWENILYRLYLHKLYLSSFACYLVTLFPCYLGTLLPCYLCYLVILLPCYAVT